MTPEQLLPYARQALRSWHRWFLWGGALLLGLGLAIIAILAAAAPLEEALVVGGIALVFAVLPGAGMLAWGRRDIEQHPLILALSQHPEQITAINKGYLQGLRGYTTQVTVVVGQQQWTFPVD